MSFVDEKQDFSKFGKNFQEGLVQLILDDRVFCDQISEVLDVNFLELNYLRVFIQKIFDYRKKYGTHPSHSTIATILRSDIEKENDVLKRQIREYYARQEANNFSVEGAEHIKDVSLDFCKKQKLKEAMIKSVSLIQNASYDEVSKVINEALKLGNDNDLGYDYLLDFEQRFELKSRNAVSTGWDLIDGITRGGIGRGELGVIVAPTGCHSKGTKILMFDGTFKNVEDIAVGDKTMGPNSTVRNVLKLHRGQEEMYRIIPTKGKSFIVNRGHILSLVRTNDGTSFSDKTVNISVSDYLNKSKTFKRIHKLYRPEFVDFGNHTVVEPYMVGAYLGDGSICGDGAVITSNDQELIKEVHLFAKRMNCQTAEYSKTTTSAKDIRMLGGHNNDAWKLFEEIGIAGTRSGDKFIPQSYKTADRFSRQEILAGLLDTDGSKTNGGFDYVSKSKQLAEDVVFVCQSLGLSAYASETQKCDQDGTYGTYYRVSINGDTKQINNRIPRKKCDKRNQTKSVLRTGLAIESVGSDDYYGFEVDCDNLYVMEDFFVTHNSGKSMALVHLGAAALKKGLNVVYYSLELGDEVIGSRFDSCLTGFPLNNLGDYKEHILDTVKEIKGKLIIKEYPTKSATTNTIKHHLEKLQRKDIKIDMVIVDYGDLLRPVSVQKEKRNELESIYEELRGLSQEFNCCLWTASQSNRSGLNAEIVTLESISEAFNKCFVADFICTISRTVKDKNTNEGRIFVAKNRNGPDGLIFPIFMDTSIVKIKVLQQTGESVEDLMAKSTKDQANVLRQKYKDFKQNG